MKAYEHRLAWPSRNRLSGIFLSLSFSVIHKHIIVKYGLLLLFFSVSHKEKAIEAEHGLLLRDYVVLII